MKEAIERLKELAKKESWDWTPEELAEYKQLEQATGIAIGIDGKFYPAIAMNIPR